MENPRLAVLVDEFPRLSETFIVRQINHLRPFLIARRLLRPAIEQATLNITGKAELLSPDLATKDRWHRRKQVLAWKLLRRPAYHWLPDLQPRLVEVLRNNKIEVLLAQFGFTAVNALRACQQLGIRLVIHFHGVDAAKHIQTKAYQNDLRALFAYAFGIVAVSEDMAEQLRQLGCPPEKLHLVPYGIPLEAYPFQVRNFHASPFTFVAVGRLTPKKSPLDLLRAFEICAMANPQTRLRLIGGGELQTEVDRFIETTPIRKQIDLLGPLPIEEVRREMAQAHAFIQHSVTAPDGDSEGWPLAIAEAMASGLPVVATAHKGIKQQVVHGETGFLVEEHDFWSMANYLLELAHRPDLCEKMAVAGRKHIQAVGDFGRQAVHLQNILFLHP